MALHFNAIDLIMIFLGLTAIFFFGVWIIRRKMKAYNLHILANMVNPQIPQRKFYMMPDKATGGFVLLKTLLSFFPYRTIPHFVISDYTDGKRIEAVECPLGEQDDLTIVPISKTTVSPVQVRNQVIKNRAAVIAKLIEIQKQNGTITTEALQDGFTEKWWGEIMGFQPLENIKPFYERHRQAVKFFYQKSYEKEKDQAGLLLKYGAYIILAIMIIAAGIWFVMIYQAGSQGLARVLSSIPTAQQVANAIANNLHNQTSTTSNSLLGGLHNLIP